MSTQSSVVRHLRHLPHVIGWVIAVFLSLGFSNSSLAEPTAEPLRVGLYYNPPKLQADDQGQLSGILGELLSEIARLEGWELEVVECHWYQCLTLLEAGDLDLMPDVAISDQRSDRFDFHTTPALLSWSQIYERPGLGLSSLLDLDGKRIAVLKQSIQAEYLHQLADSFALKVQWLELDSPEAGFIAVNEGRADAVAANHFLGDQQAQTTGLHASPILFQPSKLFFISSDNRQTDKLARIDHYLELWQANPESFYFDLLKRWGIDKDKKALPKEIWWLIGSLTLAFLIVLVMSQFLRRQLNERTLSLRTSEAQLNTILNSVEAYIYIKDPQLKYVYANRKVCELFGVPLDEILGKTDEAFFDANTCKKLRANDLRVIEQGERVADEEINTSVTEGETFCFLSVKLPLRHADGSIYALCGISTDITEHRQIQNQLHQLAFFDPLTGLANRRLVRDRLRHALASHATTGFEGALVVIDIDNFKTLNDTQGHDTGDLLLQQMALRIESQLRTTDSAGRVGADEFVVILEDLSRDTDHAVMDTRNITQNLIDQLTQAYDLGSVSYVVSVSAGIAMFSDAHKSLENLLKDADLALADAKSAGHNNLRFFSPTMQTRVNRRSQLEAGLRRALANQGLELYLQPQISHTGETIGMEALLRWRDDDLGQVSPAEFIPVAEASGLIIPLGEWVLEQACALIANWQQRPALAQLTLAVNISPRQFRHPKFVSHIGELLQRTHINPARLELEITENLLIEDMENTLLRLEQLRNWGLVFSLDDFGTGYASLGHLKRLPLYQLKIDQSFVRDLLTDPNDEAIVRTIIALGKSLELRVIAEGVETAEQAERLKALGCLIYQGYFFGRPEPIHHWQQRLENPYPHLPA